MKKDNLPKWIITAAVIIANALCWSMHSKIAYNVAQQREILLGRYTVDYLTVLLLLIPVSVLIINGVWSEKKKHTREDTFKIIVVIAGILLAIVLADVSLRWVHRRRYLSAARYYHRVPNQVMHGVTRDVPLTAFSYPATPPGYPDVEYTLTIDRRGFRNKTDRDKYDIVAIGDSFTEGSEISDEQVWPVLLARRTNLSVYNLGISGAGPVHYLEALKRFGPELSPRIVICMLYEGNDLRPSSFARRNYNKPHLSFKYFYHSSPLRLAIRDAMIRVFGPINAHSVKDPRMLGKISPDDPLYPVAWLPVAVPNPNGNYYTFRIKKVVCHFSTEKEFLDSNVCKAAFETILRIKDWCRRNNSRFILAYAPDKPHVVLPLVKDNLDPRQLRAFLSLKQHDLPPTEQLVDTLIARLSAKESVIGRFCSSNSIEFVSLTQPLQERTAEGQPTYFTYDQHWTPIGQQIVAKTIADYLLRHNAKLAAARME